MRVVKVGGSLFDLPDLRSRLDPWIDDQTVVVPGGGAFADVVRTLDRRLDWPAEWSHRLALHAMNVAAEMIAMIVPRTWRRVTGRERMPFRGPGLLDAVAFAATHPKLPAGWHVTSDSIAAQLARDLHADEIFLLKSTDPPAGDWSAVGFVDAHFANVVSGSSLRCRAVNLRADPAPRPPVGN